MDLEAHAPDSGAARSVWSALHRALDADVPMTLSRQAYLDTLLPGGAPCSLLDRCSLCGDSDRRTNWQVSRQASLLAHHPLLCRLCSSQTLALQGTWEACSQNLAERQSAALACWLGS